MPIFDTAAMNASLDNDYGTTRGPNAPDSHELALFAGDPMSGGVEIEAVSNPGYVRAVVLPADWAESVAGLKATSAAVQFADADDEWDDTVTHVGLFSGDDSTTLGDCLPLSGPLDVTAAGTGPAIAVTVFYDDAVTVPQPPLLNLLACRVRA